MNVSDQIVQILASVGVRHVFGIPGDTIDSLMESIRRQDTVEFIVVRHEETAAFAACGQARITGGLGVCAACQGPGANHLINGLADAAGDRLPVLAITGQVESHRIGTGLPQESSQLKLFEDFCVYNQEARSAENFVLTMHLAINAALSRNGVAHVSIPSDVMKQAAVRYPLPVPVTSHDSAIIPSDEALDAAAAVLNAARKVTILYGEGARGAADLVVQAAETLKAPLVHTTRSKDIIDNRHPHHVGGIGIMGSHPGNHALHDCDALLIVGCNFGWREFYPAGVPIVKIDREAINISAHLPISHPLWGTARHTLQRLLPRLEPRSDDAFCRKERDTLTRLIDEYIFDPRASDDRHPLHPPAVIDRLMKKLDDDAIICGDCGTTTIWFNNVALLTGRQRFLWSANLASLGCALPHAIGAKLAAPDRQVIAVAGDGGFQMLLCDLITAVMYDLAITFVILNNSAYQFIEFEEASHEGTAPSGTKFLNPDYARVAEAHGALGFPVRHYREFDDALDRALSSGRTCVLDVFVDPKARMIPPAVTPHMAINYVKSVIRSWITPPTDDEVKAAEAEARTHLHV